MTDVAAGEGAKGESIPRFLSYNSGMAARMRAYDWSATPLGPATNWPQCLTTPIQILLTSRFAMWMAWGPELTFICNDAYLPTVGVKRDWVLGARSDQVWAEIWSGIGPRIAHVLSTGEATWDEALQLYLERNGFPEETYHTFSYSPLANDEGAIAGMLCVVAEVTERVIGERQLAALRDLGTRLAAASTRAQVMSALEQCLAAAPRDLPLALAYFADADGAALELAAIHGISRETPTVAQRLPLDGSVPSWVSTAMKSGDTQLIEIDRDLVAGLSLDHWQIAPHRALVLPIRSSEEGVPVAALSPA